MNRGIFRSLTAKKQITEYAEARALLKRVNSLPLSRMAILTVSVYERYRQGSDGIGIHWYAHPQSIALCGENKRQSETFSYTFIGDAIKAFSDYKPTVPVYMHDHIETLCCLRNVGMPVDFEWHDIRHVEAILTAGSISKDNGTKGSSARSNALKMKAIALRYGTELNHRSPGRIVNMPVFGYSPGFLNGVYTDDDLTELERRASLMLRIADIQMDRLVDRGQLGYYYTHYLPSQRFLFHLTVQGLPVDRDVWNIKRQELEQEERQALDALAEEPYRLLSPYSEKEIEIIRNRICPTGVSVLNQFDDLLHRLKVAHTALSVLSHEEYIDESDRIHPRYDRIQDTGRASNTALCFANLPRLHRGIISTHTRPGWSLVDLDVSGVEAWVAKYIYCNENASFKGDGDFHCQTTRAIFPECSNLADDEIKKKEPRKRKVAKAAFFGLLFGQSVTSAARQHGMPEDQISIAFEAMRLEFPGLQDGITRHLCAVTQRRYSRTRRGHIRMLPLASTGMSDGEGREMRNHPVQAAATESFFEGCIRIFQFLQELYPNAHIIFVLHDSLLIEVPDEYAQVVAERASQILTGQFNRDYPGIKFKASIAISKAWGEKTISQCRQEKSL